MVDGGEIHRHVHRRRLDLHFIEFSLYRPEHADVGGALGLEDAEGGGRTSVQARDGADFLGAVVHVGNLPQADRPAAARDDLRVRQGARRLGTAEHADGLFAAADLRSAAGRIEIEGP